jgi:hypothetical protein
MVVIYPSPIRAICRRCHNEFALHEILEKNDGTCPRCSWSLSRDWESLLFEQARIADRAQQVLVKSLRRLVSLPGNLAILPHSVFRNLFEEVGWEITLAKEPAVIREELRLLHEEVDRWDRLGPDRDHVGFVARLRHVASRLRYLGGVADALESGTAIGEPASGTDAREAANALESAAAEIAHDRSQDSSVRESIATARRAVDALASR